MPGRPIVVRFTRPNGRCRPRMPTETDAPVSITRQPALRGLHASALLVQNRAEASDDLSCAMVGHSQRDDRPTMPAFQLRCGGKLKRGDQLRRLCALGGAAAAAVR